MKGKHKTPEQIALLEEIISMYPEEYHRKIRKILLMENDAMQVIEDFKDIREMERMLEEILDVVQGSRGLIRGIHSRS